MAEAVLFITHAPSRIHPQPEDALDKRLAIRLVATDGLSLPEPSKADRTSMEEALGELVNALWPTNTRNMVRREFNLSDNDARRVVEGRASKRHIQMILRHPRGEYAVGLYLLARVIGRDLEPYLHEEAELERRERETSLNRISRLQSRVSERSLVAAE